MKLRLAQVGLWAAAALAWGCSSPPSNAAQELEQVRQEGARMQAAFDGLEERLLADRAQVDLWKELQVRHQHVSALATVNAQEHIEAMERHSAREQARFRAKARAAAQGRGPPLASVSAGDIHR